MRVAHTRDSASFDDAFAAARAAKCDEFIWRGARYHTRKAGEERDERPVILRIEEEDRP